MSPEQILGLTIRRFETGQIDAEHFDHEAHVYVGWLYLQAYDLAAAIARFDKALGRLTNKLGVPEKYHATITWAFLILINECCRDGDSWPAFRSRNSHLITDSKTLLGRYYSDRLLFSDRARRQFVFPDRLAS
jgi:N-formylglutamate deformylase